MLYSVLIASAVPLVFLYIVHWLNFFETHRPKLIFLALAWGAVASWLSYLVSHPLVPILGRQFVSTHTAPIVEEIFKSLILLYLVRRADYTYMADGAIYGFAAGIGFAVSENMLYLSRVDVNTGLIVAIARAFSSSVIHGCATAMVGIVIGGFPLGRASHPIVALLIGWTAAVLYHMAYNRITFMQFGQWTLFVIVGFALFGLVLVGLTMSWGLRREQKRLRRSLGMGAGVSMGEARLVQRIEDLDDLLEPVGKRFGGDTRDSVANVVLLGAQLGMKQDLLKRTKDAELRSELATEITAVKRELKRCRREVGVYVMSYVRSIVPHTAWSMWARLEHAMATSSAPAYNLWTMLDARLSVAPPSATSLWSKVEAALAAQNRDPER